MNFVVAFLPAVDLLLQTDVLLFSLRSFESEKLCDLGTSSRVPMEARFPAHDKLYVKLFVTVLLLSNFSEYVKALLHLVFAGSHARSFPACRVSREMFKGSPIHDSP